MEVGTEISQKIRSAIKAKLMEIGSYVDDELPDYIMVMVANKKTKQQMADDLSLFLGTNTDVFTTWLHGLLVKLQTVSTDSSSTNTKSVKPKSTKDKKKEKKSKDGSGLESKKEKRKVSKTAGDGGDASKAKSARISSTDNEELTAPENENTGPNSSLSKDGSGVGQEQQNINVTENTKEDEAKICLDDVEDVRQLLVTETPADELAQELETTEAGIEKLASLASVSKDIVSHISKDASVVIDRDMIINSRGAQAEIASMSRKRKCPSSVVATVRRNAERNAEDDRSTPAVASVVKVTSRKSSFPQSMQANRALLVKAMGEAERSIAIKRKIAVSVTKPTSREDSPSEVYTPKRRKSETGVAEVSPPPYIPSRKEPSTPRLKSLAQGHERYRLGSSKQDARQLLERRERSKMTLPTTSTPRDRQELISRSRHIELFQKLGINRTELFSERERRTKEKEQKISIKSERDKPEVRNFRITAHIAPSSRSSELVKDRLTRAIEGRERSFQVTLRPSMSSQRTTSLMASRLGKVVVQRSSSSDSKKEERVSEDRHKTRVNLSRGRRLGLSLLGKEVVKRQCEAAVLSVKSGATRSQEQFKVEDSRVVESHTSSDEDESVQEKPPVESDTTVTSLRESGKSEQDGGRDKDSEDLDDMLDDDLEPDLLNDSHSHTDEFTLDLEDDEDLIKGVGQLEEEDVPTEREKPPSSGTRFIVTLDGVDGRQFEAHQDNLIVPVSPIATPLSVPNLQVSDVSKPVDQANFLLPQDPSFSVPVLKSAPPKIQPFSISLKDSDDEVEDKSDPKAFSKMAAYSHPVVPTVDQIPISEPTDIMTTLQKAKQSERCKFWPACAAGPECEFHHPTSYCKTFPNCKFGDKCLFIHPNCKFDSKCTRVDCPFTHTSRRPVMAAPASQKPPPYYPQYIPFSSSPQATVCRFYPNCHNVNCPFVHPKPCRFGVSCQSTGCPFLHPSLPSKDKLKWTAQADQQQPAKDGVGLTTTTLLAQSSVAKPPLSNSSPAGSSAVSSTSV